MTPPRRLVLLGASNLTRGVSAVVGTSLVMSDGPLEILMAAGHGRSYCGMSAVLGRSLPGIPQCGLWRALAEGGRRPVDALVTDIGNDLLYQVSPAVIAANVDECLDRLQSIDAKVAVSALPVANLETLSPARFRFFRTLFFPKCRLSLSDISAAARELDARVREAAAKRRGVLVEQRPEWYGFDPIHIERRVWSVAWREMLSPLYAASAMPPPVRGSLARWLKVRPVIPERVWFAGREFGRDQPAARWAEGSTLAAF